MADEQQPDSLEQIRPKSRVGLVIGVILGGVAVAAAAFVLLDKRQEAQTKTDIETSFSRLSTCLVGDPTITDELTQRLRAVQLAVAEENEDKADVWPFRCGKYAEETYKKLIDHRRTQKGVDDLGKALDAAAAALKTNGQAARLADYSVVLSTVWNRAAAEGYKATRVTDVPAAPTPVHPQLTAPELRKFTPLIKRPLALSAIKRELHVHSDVAFLIDDATVERAPFVCVANESAKNLTCTSIAKGPLGKGSPALTASRALGQKPLVSIGPNGSGGIYHLDGRPVIEGEKFGWATAEEGGNTVALSFRDSYMKGPVAPLKLWRTTAGKTTESMVDPPDRVGETNVAYSAFLGSGFVAWHGYDKAADDFGVSIQPILPEGLGPRQNLGVVGLRHQSEDTWITCQSPGMSALVFRGPLERKLMIQTGGTWAVPVQVFALGELACHGGDVTFTWGSEKGIDHSICRLGSCQNKFIKLPPVKKRTASTVGKSLASLGNVHERGGMWLRVAGAGDLEKAPGKLLFDDLFLDGKLLELPWVLETRLLPMGGAALLFVTTKESTWALEVSDDGKVQPMSVRFE